MTTSPTLSCFLLARPLRWVASALCLSLAGSCLLAAEPAATPPANPPMAPNQLVMTVLQSGVPQVATKGETSVSKVRAISVNLRRLGQCDGNVTLKIGFVGEDVVTKKKILVSQTEKKAEATPGKGNDYSETSAPFVYNPPSIDPKTKKPIPASGSKPLGWVVRVFQGDKLLAATASNPDLVDWVAHQ